MALLVCVLSTFDRTDPAGTDLARPTVSERAQTAAHISLRSAQLCICYQSSCAPQLCTCPYCCSQNGSLWERFQMWLPLYPFWQLNQAASYCYHFMSSLSHGLSYQKGKRSGMTILTLLKQVYGSTQIQLWSLRFYSLANGLHLKPLCQDFAKNFLVLVVCRCWLWIYCVYCSGDSLAVCKHMQICMIFYWDVIHLSLWARCESDGEKEREQDLSNQIWSDWSVQDIWMNRKRKCESSVTLIALSCCHE